MHKRERRPGRRVLPCTRCGREITEGETYWYCSGSCICGECLADFARSELRPYRQVRGQEEAQ